MTVKCTICGSMTVPCKCSGQSMYELPPFPQFYPKQEGWICPVCGRGNAPTTPQCFCKNNPNDLKATAP